MRERLPDELRALLLDTAGEPNHADHAEMLRLLIEEAEKDAAVLAEARRYVMRAAADHGKALRILREREKLITDEAMRRLLTEQAMRRQGALI